TAFGPRVGVAYELSQNPRWGRVVRAGWGIFHDTPGDAAVFISTLNGATTCNQVLQFPPTLAQQTPPPANNSAPWTNSTGVTSLNPNLRLPNIYQMSAAIEQSLGAKQALTLTYAGAIGRDLFL